MAAGDAKEIWSLSYSGERPVAVFFDANSSAIYVSVVDSRGKGRLDRVSLEGKLEKKGLAFSKEEPGAIRAFDGKIYWVAGLESVQIVDADGDRTLVSGVPKLSRSSLIAVDHKGAVYLVQNGHSLFRVMNGKAELLRDENKITGIFLLLDRLYLLEAGKMVSISINQLGKKELLRQKFCDCKGLERTSSGEWLTIDGEKVIVGGKGILTLKTEIGLAAYVYRMNTSEDFFVLPLVSEGILRAYRMPGAENRKTIR